MKRNDWEPGPAHSALARPGWWASRDSDWGAPWHEVALAAAAHSPGALILITRAAITGAILHVPRRVPKGPRCSGPLRVPVRREDLRADSAGCAVPRAGPVRTAIVSTRPPSSPQAPLPPRRPSTGSGWPAPLAAEWRRRRGTPRGSRALICFWQAVLGLRWFRDRADPDALAPQAGG